MDLKFVPFLHRATHAVDLHLGRLKGPRILQGEAHVLAYLWEEGPRSIADLNAALHHKKSTLTSILDRLESRGFVGRQSDPDDRRTFIVRLTGAGEREARRVHRHLEQLEKTLGEHFTQKELEIAQKVLVALTQL
jgi:DNA-binding MarR family transcriptional regulator